MFSVAVSQIWTFVSSLFICIYPTASKALCLTHAAVFSASRRTHPLFIQLQQGVPDLRGVWGQAKAVQVQLRHDELQQPLGWQAPRGRVTGGRRHWLLQDGTSQRLHLRGRFAFVTSSRINWTHAELEDSKVWVLPLWCERWFCNCTELRWILLSPLDGSWWPLDRGDRPCRRNSGVLWWQYSHTDTTVNIRTVTELCLKYVDHKESLSVFLTVATSNNREQNVNAFSL